MQLSVKDIVKFLNVSERTVYRWIKDSDIPFYKVHEQYRFNKVEILEWAVTRRIPVSPQIFDEEKVQMQSLSQAIELGGIHYRIGGTTKEQVLRNVVQVLRLPEEVDADFLLKVLLARESLESTAIGEGIAVPHPRSPIVLHIMKPMVTLCFLDTPIDFGALDGEPVYLLFTILTPTIRSHLFLLSRLSFALKNPVWKQTLAKQGSREEILNSVKEIENNFPSSRHMGNA